MLLRMTIFRSENQLGPQIASCASASVGLPMLHPLGGRAVAPPSRRPPQERRRQTKPSGSGHALPRSQTHA